MEQRIEFVGMKTMYRPVALKDAFALTPSKGWLWVQRLCFWILAKIGAFHIAEVAECHRYVVDESTFIERLFKQRSEMVGHFNRRPSRLLIGAEDYQELMCEAMATQGGFEFSAQYGHGRSIYGLTVEVIPWMRGILVMP